MGFVLDKNGNMIYKKNSMDSLAEIQGSMPLHGKNMMNSKLVDALKVNGVNLTIDFDDLAR